MTALFDNLALSRNRKRANADGMFLQQRAADQIMDRLAEVNRAFTSIAVITAFPDNWAPRLPDAQMVSEGEVLEFDSGPHDLIIHALSMHWSNDPVGQMIQCRRAMQPDGLFLAVMFGGRTLQELRTSLAEAESHLTGGLSPRVAPMAELRDLGGLLQRAGFALPVADGDLVPVSYASLPDLIRDLRAMGETSALAARPKTFSKRALFDRAVQVYAQHFSQQDRLFASFEMIFLTGWAPSADQPKPLRPGSAQNRLADALGVAEIAADDPIADLERNKD